MGDIQLSVKNHQNYTTISNQFIDNYMPSANGSFVKVYLYLLRSLSKPGCAISISGMADCFENTEKDILRALMYWEKMKLLTISKDSNGEISDIQLIEPVENEAEDTKAGSDDSKKAAAWSGSGDNAKTAAWSGSDGNAKAAAPAGSYAYVKTGSETSIEAGTKSNTAASRVDFTNLKDRPELDALLQIVETYLARLLKPQDIENISFFYNELHFSPDLIEHLYDYCVSKGKKKASYIQAVAAMWAQEGIHTREEAIAFSEQYNETYNEIKRAFSLGRMLGEAERKFADTWCKKYKSPLSLIKEACSRSLLKTGKPDFAYADKILENWAKKDITTMEQVLAEDKEHKKKTLLKANEKKAAAGFASSPFKEKPQNFKQRSYSSEEISSIEKKSLKKLTTAGQAET